jgi:wobble nucleotide-excising tRNase
MIKKIEEINKVGIFDNYKWKCSKEFNKYNIFFGFNGSGKSTLSNFFNLIATNGIFSREDKEELFKDLKTTEKDSTIIFKNNLSYPPKPNPENKKIYVFNSNFIANHVYDGTVGKMSKFNVKKTVLEDPTIKNLNTDIETKTIEKTNKETKKTKITEKFDEVKRTYNAVYRENFPNRQLRVGNVIPAATALPVKPKAEIEQIITQKIAEYKLSEKQAELETDITKISNLVFENINFDLENISHLLKQSAKENATDNFSEKIERYKKEIAESQSDKIEPWFKLGGQLLEISKEKDNNVCPVCKTEITTSIDNLITEFADYFDKSYLNFVDQLKTLKGNIITSIEFQKNNDININSLKSYGDKYNKFIGIKFPELEQTDIKNDLSGLKKHIVSKQGNSSKKITIDIELLKIVIGIYNKNIEKLNIFKNNILINLKNKKIDPTKIDIEIRERYTELIYLDLNGTNEENRIKNFHISTTEISTISTAISELTDKKIQRLKELKMEAKKVGEYLAKLGITHFTVDLQEGQEENNILIKYKGNDETKKRLQNTLSEGEKTALAFAYFMSKVTTEVTNNGQTIIVIDDPISSLDDNRIYNTAFLIHDEFKDFKQLFVFSHNMLFLKYINPFFNKKEKGTYLINKGKIEDLPASLENFQSPYFYMLESVVNFSSDAKPDYEDARKFLPNYIRRILETFFGFKYAQLSNSKGQTPGLPNFIVDIINYETIEDKTVGNITKANLKNKLNNINKVCDNFSHGNMQQLDECNFISDETLKEISTDTLDIIEFFDTMHKKQIEVLVNPALKEGIT